MPKKYQFYADASGSGDPDHHVLAGYVAPAEVWAEFSKEWQSRLDHAGLAVFKMSDHATSPKKLERAAYFYRTLEEFEITAGLTLVLPTRQIHDSLKGLPWPKEARDHHRLLNPYFYAFYLVLIMLDGEKEKWGIDEPIDLIFDNQSEKGYIIESWDTLRKNAAPDLKGFFGDPPSFKSDEYHMPLQAADLFAWCTLDWVRQGKSMKNFKFPWPLRKLIPGGFIEYDDDLVPALMRIASEKAYQRSLKMEGTLLNVIRDEPALQKRLQSGVPMSFPDPSSFEKKF
jgi:hypothetical protein